MATESKGFVDELPVLISANQPSFSNVKNNIMTKSVFSLSNTGGNNLTMQQHPNFLHSGKKNGSEYNSNMKLVQTSSGKKFLFTNVMNNTSIKAPILFVSSDTNPVVKNSSATVTSNSSVKDPIMLIKSDTKPGVKTTSAIVTTNATNSNPITSTTSTLLHLSPKAAIRRVTTQSTSPTAAKRPVTTLSTSALFLKPIPTAAVRPFTISAAPLIPISTSVIRSVTTTTGMPIIAAAVRPDSERNGKQNEVTMPVFTTTSKPLINENSNLKPIIAANAPRTIILPQSLGNTPMLLQVKGQRLPILIMNKNKLPALVPSSNTMHNAAKSTSNNISVTKTKKNSSIYKMIQNFSMGKDVYIKNDNESFKLVGKPIPIKFSNENKQLPTNNHKSIMKNVSSISSAKHILASNNNETDFVNMKMDQNKTTVKVHRKRTVSSQPPDYLNIQIKEESSESPFNDKNPFKLEVIAGIDQIKEESCESSLNNKNQSKLEVTTGISQNVDTFDGMKIKEEPPDPLEKELNDYIDFTAVGLDNLQPIVLIKEPKDEDQNNDLLAQDEQLRQLFSNNDEFNRSNTDNARKYFKRSNQSNDLEHSNANCKSNLNKSAASDIIKRLDSNTNPDKTVSKAAKFFIRTSDGKLVHISPSEAKVLGLDLSKDAEVNKKKLEDNLKWTKFAELPNSENQFEEDREIVKIPEDAKIMNYVNVNLPPVAKVEADLIRKVKHLNDITKNVPKKAFSSKNNAIVLGEFERGGKRYLRIHIEDEDNEKDICDIEITVLNRYLCPFCFKEFKTKDHIISHIRIHTGERPYPCEVCGKRYRQRIDIIRHMRIHTGEKPFECELCKASFNQKSNLRSHMRVHTGERPVQCKICGKGFSRNTHLKQHMKLHTGEKPFLCEVCNRPFRFKSGLQAHSRIHTGAKPYACGFCGRKFTQIVGLIRHEKTHAGEKPFRCKTCGKSFNSKETLQVHLTKHSSERPHKCQICSKTFTDIQSLRCHSKKYHKSMIICVICLKDDFKSRIELREHLREHERENWEENEEGDLIPTNKTKRNIVSINDTIHDSDYETMDKPNKEIEDKNILTDSEEYDIDYLGDREKCLEHIQVEVELDPDDPMEDDNYDNDIDENTIVHNNIDKFVEENEEDPLFDPLN